LSSGSKTSPDPHSNHVTLRNWNSPEAELLGFLAQGFHWLSQKETLSASSIRSWGQPPWIRSCDISSRVRAMRGGRTEVFVVLVDGGTEEVVGVTNDGVEEST